MSSSASMTKAELVEEVSRVSDLTKKDSEIIVETVFQSIIDALHRGEKIELRGFGSFRLRQREPRKGRNPKTGDKVDVPPKKVPYFKPGQRAEGSPQSRSGWRRDVVADQASVDGPPTSASKAERAPRCRGTPLDPVEAGLRDGRERRARMCLLPRRGRARTPVATLSSCTTARRPSSSSICFPTATAT